MNANMRVAQLVVATLLLVGCPTAGLSGLIWDNGSGIGSLLPAFRGGQVGADDFNLGVLTYRIIHIRWWGGYPLGDPYLDSFQVIIRTPDDEGMPGLPFFLLLEGPNPVIRREVPGGTAEMPLFQYDMVVRDTVRLSGGRYFLEVNNAPDPDAGLWFWLTSDDDGVCWAYDTEVAPGEWIESEDYVGDLRFQLYGHAE